jgi:hypothetical protein
MLRGWLLTFEEARVTIKPAVVVAMAAAIVVIGGCDTLGIGEPTRNCTLIGCTSGVTVQLSGNPGDSYRVEIFESGSSIPTKVQTCSLGADCPSMIHFTDYRPQGSVRVRVVVGSRAITSQPQTLTYVANTPNGPDCDPTCFNALVNMPLPV